PGCAFDFGGAGLSRHRPRTFVAARNRPGDVSVGDRRRSTGGVPTAVAAGRHHSGAGARARHRQGDGARAEAAERSPDGRQSLRPRRQGHPASGGHFAGEEEVTLTSVESAERAPTLALPRKRERGPTAAAARGSLTNDRLLCRVALNRSSARQNPPPLPLAGEGRGGGAAAGEKIGKRHSTADAAS